MEITQELRTLAKFTARLLAVSTTPQARGAKAAAVRDTFAYSRMLGRHGHHAALLPATTPRPGISGLALPRVAQSAAHPHLVSHSSRCALAPASTRGFDAESLETRQEQGLVETEDPRAILA